MIHTSVVIRFDLFGVAELGKIMKMGKDCVLSGFCVLRVIACTDK